MKITIDFETRSTCEIWEAGAWQYSKHPSTEILCLAYAVDDGPVKLIGKDEIGSAIGEHRIALWDPYVIFVAHNSYFERCIWQNILVEKFGWPRIPINRWRCTMAKGLAHSLPASLKNMGAALNAPIQKSDEGHRVMMRLCKPDKNGNWSEDPKDLEQLYNYCINDVEAERAIDNMVPDLIPQEQTIWFLDQLINDRGVHVDRPAIKKSLEFIKVHTDTLNNYVADVTGGVLGGVSRRMAVMDWCKSQGVDIKGYSKSDVNDTLRQDVPEVVRAVLETKLSLGKTSVAKYQAMENSVGDDNRIRDLFIYHGANTGRWTGKLIQLHNLPKGNLKDTETAIGLLKKESYEMFSIFYPDVMDTLSACIRGMIISPPGHDLLVADYSAIEARVVMWLADEKYGLSQFEKGVDLYVDMAKVIYNRQDISKGQRQLGKAAILGAGYGMGPDKFLATCLAWGISVDKLLASKAIETYRRVYASVTRSWYAQEAAAISAIRDKQSVVCGKIRWELDDTTLLAILPSGRSLKYNGASLDYVETPWGERKLALHYMGLKKIQGQTTTKWERQHTYGGKLVENITQAVARDLLAAAMLRAEAVGYKVAFSVHDEIVSEVPEGFGSVEEFEKILCKKPSWASGCPIEAKGFRTKRYRKD